MKLTPIVKDHPINFADEIPQVKEIILNAFDKIMTFENAIDGVDPDDFDVTYSSDEPTNTYGGAFITSCYGTYLLHDLREEQKVWWVDDPTECTILFFSLTKIEDDAKAI